MTKKQITIKSLSRLNKKKESPISDNIVDQWVNEGSEINSLDNNTIKSSIEKDIEETRLTVLIPTYLHRRIKKYCASHSISMKEKIIEVFKENFPET